MSDQSPASASTTSTRFRVRAGAGVRIQLVAIRDAARKNWSGAQAVVWRGILKAVRETLVDPTRALHRDHALTGDLRGVYRVKLARFRVFYLVSAPLQKTMLLLVGYRKEGDKRDAYVEVRRRIRSGEYDPLFEEMGIAKPP